MAWCPVGAGRRGYPPTPPSSRGCRAPSPAGVWECPPIIPHHWRTSEQPWLSDLDATLERAIGLCQPHVARSLDRALSGHDLSVDEATTLFEARGMDLHVLALAADALRREQVGDVVTYVVN